MANTNRVQATIPSEQYQWLQKKSELHEGLNVGVLVQKAINEFIGATSAHHEDDQNYYLTKLGEEAHKKRQAQRREWGNSLGPLSDKKKPLTPA